MTEADISTVSLSASGEIAANMVVDLLLVDDEPRNLDVLESVLHSPDYRMIRATTANDALMKLIDGDFAAIVLDIQMPGMTGLELANLIKQRKRTQHIPIIFLTAYFQEDKDVLQGYSVGAVDYLTKPINPQILRSKVAAFVDLFRTARALSMANSALKREIAQRQKVEEELLVLNNELELRVQQRTTDLTRANSELRESEQGMRKSEDKIRTLNEELQVLIDTAPVGIAVASDPECRHIWSNREFARMLNVSTDQNVSRSAPDGDKLPFKVLRQGVEVPPQDLPMQRASREGREIIDEEFTILRKDGVILHMVCKATPLRDENGRVRGCIGAFLDISKRKQIEEALRESEQRFRTLADTSPVLIWVNGLDGSVFANRAYLEFFGRSKEELLGFGWTKFVHPDDHDRLMAEYKQAVITRIPYSGEARMRRADGEWRWLLSRGSPRFAPTGEFIGFVGSSTDVTDLKRAEEKLEKAVAERTAELRETNGQLEEFVYSIAHDLRAPLRAMEACSQMLLDDCSESLNETGQQYARRINRSAETMDKLLLDLLDYGKTARSEIKLGTVNLATAWDAAVFQNQHQIGASKAHVVPEIGMPAVLAHEATLVQVLANLLSNALRFVPANVQPEIHFRSQQNGDRVRITVEDNGIGIAPEHHERIFRVFERLNGASYGGTGIGLAIVRKGVERMGGSVGVISAPGKGSQFWIDLAAAV